MILSMTGFGRGIASSSKYKITVDIKSLNSKQLDLSMRVPTAFKELELGARGKVSAALERGKVELSVSSEYIGDSSPVRVNSEVLGVYKKQLESLSAELGIAPPQDWYATLLRLPDALTSDSCEVDDNDLKAFEEALCSAISSLNDFRKAEGAKLFNFFIKKIRNISTLLMQVTPFEKERVVKIRERLEEQLSRLTSIEYDKGRLEQELIFYIEKLDVTEEKTRLTSHLNYFLETMGSADADDFTRGQGKKLGFIAQEMGREINTLGSKSNHPEMQKIVVMMKDELEQIKEQVLNVL